MNSKTSTRMKATIKLIRDTFRPLSTQGKLYFNNEYICETLEDKCRDLNHDGDLNDSGETKVYGQTAIPSGTYKMTIVYSAHFKRNVFLLHGIENYAGVLIHTGNYIKDTLGCVLVGLNRGTDCVLRSKEAMDKLMNKTGIQFSEYEIQIIDSVIAEAA